MNSVGYMWNTGTNLFAYEIISRESLIVRFEYAHGAFMLTKSRDIKQRLEKDGWMLVRVTGSHHIFKHPNLRKTIVLPHPKKNLSRGLVCAIYEQAQWERD